MITKKSGLIVGASNFTGNPNDGNTLETALDQSERLRDIKSERAIVDEGYRGRAKNRRNRNTKSPSAEKEGIQQIQMERMV